jgi:hypothetical protein
MGRSQRRFGLFLLLAFTFALCSGTAYGQTPSLEPGDPAYAGDEGKLQSSYPNIGHFDRVVPARPPNRGAGYPDEVEADTLGPMERGQIPLGETRTLR